MKSNNCSSKSTLRTVQVSKENKILGAVCTTMSVPDLAPDDDDDDAQQNRKLLHSGKNSRN